MTTLWMGVYRHYKGPLYQVLGLAHDANDETRTCVVYMPLQLDGAHEGPRIAVRTLGQDWGRNDTRGDWWLDRLYVNRRGEWLNTCPLSHRECDEIHGRWTPDKGDSGCVPRFEYLGPEFKREMLP